MYHLNLVAFFGIDGNFLISNSKVENLEFSNSNFIGLLIFYWHQNSENFFLW